MDNDVLFWLIAGVILILAELILPGLVVVFMGIAALVVALGLQLGLLDGIFPSAFAWMMTTLVLVLTLRSFFARFAPGDKERGNMDEDLDAFGSLVDVINIDTQNPNVGRVTFRGSTWKVESMDGPLMEGGKVRLLKRENLIWLVEPVID